MRLRCLEDMNSPHEFLQQTMTEWGANTMNKAAEWSPASKGSEMRYKGAHLKGKLRHLAYLAKYVMAILALFL